ncbi:EF-hand domain-containing protein [uncultured Formosa sp.]|uniref:EF-hand domain-containing protein n=1 Tax=uncultured Formosa sp. TaxID=255435 RepID=UPI00260291A9|nr:EF-hand domain-containing protein [uncultured Formosa sp.]
MKLIKISALVLVLLSFSNISAQEEKQKRDPKVAFERLDTNEDGKLSLEELEAREVRVKENDENKKPPVDTKKMFARKDKNSDGFLDLEEFSARPPKK